MHTPTMSAGFSVQSGTGCGRHVDFLARGISARLRKEAVAIAKWAVDTSVEKGARPKPDISKYLSDVSWQHGHDFNEPLRGETLA